MFRILPLLAAVLLSPVALPVSVQAEETVAEYPGKFPQVNRWKLEGWKTDFTKRRVDLSEIMSGGPPKDGIPPLDDPQFVDVSEAANLQPNEPVIGLEINGDARAYPLQVLMWHEIANDVVGGKPVAVTYCPLCNAALVFDATLNGKTMSFGTTGKLRNSDLVMYDRGTESWWQQFTGEAIAGSMTGKSLKLVPSRLESWSAFAKRHPKGKVLVPNNPGMRNYGRNPYIGYDSAAKPFLYNGAMPDGINPMARVVVVRRDDNEPLIVSMQKVRDAGGFESGAVKLSWTPGQASALDSPVIAEGRDVGAILASDTAGKPLVYDVTFAFVAHAFHPKVTIIK
ncbi:DUF3179 domain-containing protein [Pseudahrensia aquimaris]|uniref:DUF3179 domain-containing protein n=1 Tax=Pseudahrensia aquimaris TaxID=744461 RepID=A0ABW3FG29_9HYPH